LAFVDRKASASDALREPYSQALKLGDPLIDPFRSLARKARPVSARWNAISRKFGALHTDLFKTQSNPLSSPRSS
jgi:hypothetical protein